MFLLLGLGSVHNQRGNVENQPVQVILPLLSSSYLSPLFYSPCYHPNWFPCFWPFLPSSPSALHCCSSLKHYCGHITTQIKNFNDSPKPSGQHSTPSTSGPACCLSLSSVILLCEFSFQLDGCIALPFERYIIHFLASVSFPYLFSTQNILSPL